MLGTLENNQKSDWKKYVSSLVFFYNSTPHESTKIFPFELMFGRRPKLPVDIEFEQAIDDSPTKTTKDYISDLKNRMDRTREIVKRHIQKAKSKNKKYYDRKAKGVKITCRDTVSVKRVAFDGKHKIFDKFEDETYIVIQQPRHEIPVFRVRAKDTELEKTLHRNLLLKIESETVNETDEIEDNKDASIVNKTHDVMDKRLDISKGEDFVIVTAEGGDAHLPKTDSRLDNKENGGDKEDSDEDSDDLVNIDAGVKGEKIEYSVKEMSRDDNLEDLNLTGASYSSHSAQTVETQTDQMMTEEKYIEKTAVETKESETEETKEQNDEELVKEA